MDITHDDGEFENESDIIELLQRINSKVNQAPNIPPIIISKRKGVSTSLTK